MTSEMNTSIQSRRFGGGHCGTPESEFSNFECFQNYTAPEVFIQGLAGIVNQGDVEMMIRAQKQMLQRFEKTNEMLLNCNSLSAGRLKIAGEDFKKHIKLLNDMKKDLDYIFKKIRTVRTKISQQYPDAYALALPQRFSFAEECEDDDSENGILTTGMGQASKSSESVTTIANDTADKVRIQKRNSESTDTEISVDYVQMKQSPDNGQLSGGELNKTSQLDFQKNAISDDSSDGTSHHV